MDPSPKSPKPNITLDIPTLDNQSEIYEENAETMADLNKGKFHVAKFWGQTHLYIPNALAYAVGRTVIMQLAQNIYTQKVLERFHWSKYNYAHSFFLELPPQGMNEQLRRDETDQRVEQLIAAIENYKK